MQTPVLAYPCFECNASEFQLQTDASAVGLGAVLEQDGHVIAYATQHFNRECTSVSKLVKRTIMRKYWEIPCVHPLFLCVNCMLIAHRTRRAQATCAP